MQLEQQIYQALAVGSPRTDAEGRVYPLKAAQGAALPRITFNRVSTDGNDSLDRASSLDQVRLQFDCWATTAEGAARLASQVRALMEGAQFKGRLRGSFDAYEQDTQVYRRSMDFRCWEVIE